MFRTLGGMNAATSVTEDRTEAEQGRPPIRTAGAARDGRCLAPVRYS